MVYFPQKRTPWLQNSKPEIYSEKMFKGLKKLKLIGILIDLFGVSTWNGKRRESDLGNRLRMFGHWKSLSWMESKLWTKRDYFLLWKIIPTELIVIVICACFSLHIYCTKKAGNTEILLITQNVLSNLTNNNGLEKSDLQILVLFFLLWSFNERKNYKERKTQFSLFFLW